MQHVSIVSSKRMPEQLGDRELFTGELTEAQQSTEINYNVAMCGGWHMQHERS